MIHLIFAWLIALTCYIELYYKRPVPGLAFQLCVITHLPRHVKGQAVDLIKMVGGQTSNVGLKAASVTVIMSSNDEKPQGVVELATSGIQDVAALLPLLGTGQCERLVTSALQRGLLHAAATPMSIFGSLGIAKAGFVVLWGSTDFRWFHGPSLLRNAGFAPSGIGELLVHVAEDHRHLYAAEDKVRCILAKKRIQAVEINLLSKDFIWWNIRLVCATVFLSAFALLPYTFLITQPLSNQSFQTTWLYPILRIVGCDIVAISIQFIFQFRILEETYSRIRFMATNAFLKDHGKALPPFWDPNERSKSTLKQLRNLCHSSQKSSGVDQPPVPSQSPPLGRRHRGLQRPNHTILDDYTKECIQGGLGTLSSFSFPLFVAPDADQPLSPPPAPTPPRDPGSNPSIADKVLEEDQPAVLALPLATHIVTTTLFLYACQAALFVGLILVVVGYVGCFSIVKDSLRAEGALVWLVCEALLAVIRTLVWAANPKWDDAKSPIALEKVVRTPGDKAEAKEKKSSYGIGWMLNAVTADDMHAVIVGIDEYKSRKFCKLTECVRDAKQVASYLEDTLLVPRDQIVTLHNSQATKERIIEELEALSRKASVAQDAPIIIYFASHSFVADNKRAYLVPHASKVHRQTPSYNRSKGEDDSTLADAYISYDSIVDILRCIAEQKTDNIILILDSCHTGAMGINNKFNNPSSPRPSQPQFSSRGIAVKESPTKETDDGVTVNEVKESSSDEDVPKTHSRSITRGVRLTKKTAEILVGHSSHILIAGTGADDIAREQKNLGGNFTRSLLESLKKSKALGEMTYKKLVDEINAEMKGTGQEAICTSIYQNRLLFNGLFSRSVHEDGLTPVITVRYSDF
ncbi:hypothetical protein EST38_g462 [Candolleomyces aberdarensis]|uniref:Peptidase C14 caspase domain-containing protein n=1 Tax=Candolleomyces aberdarensis TaxID=2316362 RepID=A0A4Q2DXD5_9AGAR|nr:hypothetical protein EST38_g462 [Candolleomyces aberdarensis]